MRKLFGNYRHRVLGVGFILLVAALVAAAVADYSGVFRSRIPVTLRAGTSADQLSPGAEVRFHGADIGRVEKIAASGDAAILHLQLQPDSTDLIPANVRARILPKTLIGQKYVDLVLPQQPNTERIAAGDVIPADRTKTATDLETALNNLQPVLRAVPPQQISSTLHSLASALRGRGEQLGQTLVKLQRYVSKLNPAVPALRDDIRKLATFSETYTDAAPELLAALRDATVTANTVAQRRKDLRTLYSTLTKTARDTRTFVAKNADNLIELTATSRPTLELLARYAPEYPCLLKQLAGLVPKVNRAFGAGTDDPGLRITLEVTNNRGRYKPRQDEPAYNDNRGPRCYPVRPRAPQYAPGGPLQDGATKPPAPDNAHGGGGSQAGSNDGPQPAALLAPAPSGADMGLPNSPRESRYIASILAAASNTTPQQQPEWNSLLLGPVLRGSEVTFR